MKGVARRYEVGDSVVTALEDVDLTVEAGEFIVVPHGVEHCPVALDDICEVVLLEPRSTIHAGSAKDGRGDSTLGRFGGACAKS